VANKMVTGCDMDDDDGIPILADWMERSSENLLVQGNKVEPDTPVMKIRQWHEGEFTSSTGRKDEYHFWTDGSRRISAGLRLDGFFDHGKIMGQTDNRNGSQGCLEELVMPMDGEMGRRRWLSGTILTSLVLDSTRFWVRTSARTPILRNTTTGGDITGGFCPGAGFPSCHKSIYRVSDDNFRGSACVPEWMVISVKRWGGWSFIT
jgi:hypothetical protein